ncbi:hypothetical protein SO3561_08682 [Streptomyces olivochromogenes]|uniref:Uncharacterized protein n=1 Tax=Streptomyces olivochromogenes TaxID=1963 RepID=A0A250VSW3_STROL|nr:hypothetical protein SO3561_08682 [Streptomyces olivochromogenes]
MSESLITWAAITVMTRRLTRRKGRTAPPGVPHHASSHGWNRHRPSEMTSSLSSLTRMAVSSSMK